MGKEREKEGGREGRKCDQGDMAQGGDSTAGDGTGGESVYR